MNDELLQLSHRLVEDLQARTGEIDLVTRAIRILSLNALIEAAHAGSAGVGFAVVAQEVSNVSTRIDGVIANLRSGLDHWVVELDRAGNAILTEAKAARLHDLSLNAIEIIDRNLYERSCDVRWWATDSAVIDCCQTVNTAEGRKSNSGQFCSKRLGVILDAYTVYLDIWVCGLDGRVLSTGRPGKYPKAGHANVRNEPWFTQAMHTTSGQEYAVSDIATCRELDNRAVATYAAVVRKGGASTGDPIGVLGIFFDWEAQSQTVMDGIRICAEERPRTRSMILDARHRVLASSKRLGILSEIFPLKTDGKKSGSYSDENGNLIGFALTPGYETYQGLGWYGVVMQSQEDSCSSTTAQKIAA